MSRRRIRSLKPEFFEDEKVGELAIPTRLLFIGLITMADDEGRLRDLGIRHTIFPWDEKKITARQVVKMLDEMEDAELILRYEHGVGKYIVIRNWARHQRINKPVASTLPEPPDAVIVEENGIADSGKAPAPNNRAIPEAVRRAVAKREGASPGADTDVECAYCGHPGVLTWAKTASGRASSWVRLTGLEWDHVVPVARGGEHTPENLLLACPRCNRSRGARPLETADTGTRTDDVRNPVHESVHDASHAHARSVPFPSFPKSFQGEGQLTREVVAEAMTILEPQFADASEESLIGPMGAHPNADLLRGCHLAVSWAQGPDWSMTGCAATLAAALGNLEKKAPTEDEATARRKRRRTALQTIEGAA